MSKEAIINHVERSLNPDSTSENFKLDEIQWDNHYPVYSKLIPFENHTKKIIEDLEQEKAQGDNKIHNN